MKTITILEHADKNNLKEVQRIIITVKKGYEDNVADRVYVLSELQRALNLLADFELENNEHYKLRNL